MRCQAAGLAGGVLIFLACASPTARAEALSLGQQPYAYTVLDESLRDVLRQFGANTGLRVTISDAVQGRVRGRREPLPPAEFLDRLAMDFSFDWYYDGHMLYVSAHSESAVKLVPLGAARFADLRSNLDALGIADRRFALRAAPQSGKVLVGGPPRYVELVEQVAQTLAKPPELPPTNVTVFRGSATP